MTTKLTLIALMLSITFVSLAIAQDKHAHKWNTNGDNVVVDGYDVVSYFNMDEAVKGTAAHTVEFDGVIFHFSSTENMEAFKKSPAKYAPKYGGFCAYAVGAKDALVSVDPGTFKLYNGELLLFFNNLAGSKGVNTKVLWNADEKQLYGNAEKNWSALQ